MKNACTYFLVVACVATLSACSGGGGGGGSSTTTTAFGQIGTKGLNLVNKYAASTPTSSMPQSGTASYTGAAAFSANSNPNYILTSAEVVSNLALQANFANSTISGSFTDFVDYQNTKYSGSAAVNGTISGNQLAATVNGTVTVPGDPMLITGSMNGTFINANAAAVTGGIVASLDGRNVYGLFIAEK